MPYIIVFKEKYGKDTFKNETLFTKGAKFNLETARKKRDLMQKYSTSLIYRVRKVK